MSERECKLTECQGKPRCRTCLAMDASYPTSALEAARHAIDEAIKAAEQPRTRRLGPDDAAWDDGYLNGIKACGSVVLAALASERMAHGIGSSGPATSVASSHLCSLGVGCDETGLCYAKANGQPDRCGRLEEQSHE